MLGRLGILSALVGSALGGHPAVPELPDLASTEPQVRAVIEEAHERLRGDPASAEHWGGYASILDAHAYAQEAMDAYRTAARLDPDEFRWPYLLAVLLSMLDPPASLPSFETARRINGNYAPLHVRYAAIMERMGRADAAIESYRRALAADDSNARAHAGLGQRLLGDGRPQAAKVHLDRAVELDPESRPALSGLAAYYRQTGDLERARDFARQSAAAPERGTVDEVLSGVRQQGRSTTAVLVRVEALRNAGRDAEASRQVRELVRANPRSARGRNMLGELYREGGNYAAALEQFRGALHVAPEFVPARLGLAQVLTRLGRLAEAQTEYERIISEHPASVRAHTGLGACLARQGRLGLALESMRWAFELGPDDRRARVGYGWALFYAGQYEQSLEALQPEVAGAENPPDDIAVEALGIAGLAELQLGRYEEASRLLLRAVEASAGRADLRRGLALALMARGRDDEAANVLERGVSIDPEDGQTAVMLVRLLSTSPGDDVRNGDRALRIAERLAASTRRRNPEVLEVLACAYAETGRFEEAARTARQAIALAREKEWTQLIERLEAQLAEFEAGRPYRRN